MKKLQRLHEKVLRMIKRAHNSDNENEVINKQAAEIIESAKICFICKEKYEDKHPKYRVCCHYTEEYRGVSHSICNF